MFFLMCFCGVFSGALFVYAGYLFSLRKFDDVLDYMSRLDEDIAGLSERLDKIEHCINLFPGRQLSD